MLQLVSICSGSLRHVKEANCECPWQKFWPYLKNACAKLLKAGVVGNCNDLHIAISGESLHTSIQ